MFREILFMIRLLLVMIICVFIELGKEFLNWFIQKFLEFMEDVDG